MDQVDQGTVVMFTLAFLLAAAASMWFACNWYQKREKTKREEEAKKLATKTKVKQTFSRFSNVDEELVNYIYTNVSSIYILEESIITCVVL